MFWVGWGNRGSFRNRNSVNTYILKLRLFQGLSSKKRCITKTFILLYDFETIYDTVQCNRGIHSVCSWMVDFIVLGVWMLLLLFLECACLLPHSHIQKWSLKDRFESHWKCERGKFYSRTFFYSFISEKESLENCWNVTEGSCSKCIVK